MARRSATGRPRAPRVSRKPHPHDRVRRRCSRCTPTSSRSATAGPTRPRASRLEFAAGFSDNLALRMFYGAPHDLLSVGGFTAWRVGGTLAIAAAVFGLLAAVRALRTEEDTGRDGARPLLGRRPGRDVPRGARRDRRRHRAVCGWRSWRAFSPPGCPPGHRRTSPWRRPRSCRSVRASARVVCQLAPDRRVALQLGGAVVGPVLHAARGRRHGRRRGVAALGDAAGMGGGDASLHRRAAARPAAPDRRRRAFARGGCANRRPARHRHRDAARARHGAPAPGAALLAGGAGAAQRARRPDRVGESASRCSPASSASSPRA